MSTDPFGIVGTIVDGRYRVDAVAGAGGFGVVYRAFHLSFQSPIALKVLKLPSAWSPAQRNARLASFRQEGRVLFQLAVDDPGIVRVLESGTVHTSAGAAPYLTLEWLEGASLAEELAVRRREERRPFELGEVLSLLETPALSLGRAHQKGIVHRDVKPGNLFATLRDGAPHVKVLDFGLAELVRETGPEGAILRGFTPRYAAPEQRCGRADQIGPWTDVHALAFVCTEMLTGALPDFEGSPAGLGEALPPSVRAVLRRALNPEPTARFEDAAVFWAALRAAAEGSSVAAREAVELASLAGETSRAERGAALGASPESSHDTQTNVTVTHPTASRSRAERGRTSPPSGPIGKALAVLVLLSAATAPLVQHERSGKPAPPAPVPDSPPAVAVDAPVTQHAMAAPAASAPSPTPPPRPVAHAPAEYRAAPAGARRSPPEPNKAPTTAPEPAILERLPATRFAVSRTSVDFDDPALRRRK